MVDKELSRLGTHHDQIGSSNAAFSSAAVLDKLAKGSTFENADMISNFKDLVDESEDEEMEDPDNVDPDDSVSNVGTEVHEPDEKKRRTWWDKARAVESAVEQLQTKIKSLKTFYDQVKQSVTNMQKDLHDHACVYT